MSFLWAFLSGGFNFVLLEKMLVAFINLTWEWGVYGLRVRVRCRAT